MTWQWWLGGICLGKFLGLTLGVRLWIWLTDQLRQK